MIAPITSSWQESANQRRACGLPVSHAFQTTLGPSRRTSRSSPSRWFLCANHTEGFIRRRPKNETNPIPRRERAVGSGTVEFRATFSEPAVIFVPEKTNVVATAPRDTPDIDANVALTVAKPFPLIVMPPLIASLKIFPPSTDTEPPVKSKQVDPLGQPDMFLMSLPVRTSISLRLPTISMLI